MDTPDLASPERLGARLRELREQSGRSLRSLAAELEISASALSQIERGALQPSVNRLLAIITALDVPLSEAFEDRPVASVAHAPHDRVVVTRSTARPDPLELGTGVVYRRLSPSHMQGVDFFESTYPPGSSGDEKAVLHTHEGYEVGNVTQGTLTIRFEDESVELEPGDSITYPSRTPHLIANPHDETAVAVWLIVHPEAR
ncbi:helix-turn-helix domain-containing protein [Gryllotalpicola protaetiae]|uniref:Cupin domain-containing protein n=1 Tax=Gryllotalpicola protaetiae TaxID=2419771 RepID=A0A387BWV9_9MICO|nr:cupin domain-containing protein [Gryllotalpicola protaetiae]AYG02821.1 cupin domain-containing protein [Gryllotalpicola protaetiae]